VLFERAPSGVQVSAEDSGLSSKATNRYNCDFARVRTKPLEFFCQPVTFDCPITAKSWAAIYCPPSTASMQVGKSSRSPLHRAAACPLHQFIEAAINRWPLPEGILNHYNSVMIGKQKVFAAKITIAVRVLRSNPRENGGRSITVM